MKTIKHIKPERTQHDREQRRKHFLSVWLTDPELKKRLQAAADAEGRSANNFFNTYIAPEIEAVLAIKDQTKLTASQRLAKMESAAPFPRRGRD